MSRSFYKTPKRAGGVIKFICDPEAYIHLSWDHQFVFDELVYYYKQLLSLRCIIWIIEVGWKTVLLCESCCNARHSLDGIGLQQRRDILDKQAVTFNNSGV